MVTISLSAGIFSQSLIPQVIGNGATFAEIFELYRILKFRFRLIRDSALSGPLAACFIPGVIDTLSGESLTGIFTTRPNVVLVKDAVAPTPWCKVPKNILNSYMTWYKTLAGTTDPADEVQGFLVAAGTGTNSCFVQLELTYQFKNQVPPGVTPQMRVDQQMRAEKERLLRILSIPSQKPAPAVPCSSVQTPGSPYMPKN